MRRVCEIGLKRKGYQVISQEDPERGWELLCTNSFDLLVTDYQMPNLSGLELIGRMRSSGIQIPCLLISGNLPAGIRTNCRELAPMSCMQKPFGMVSFLEKVSELLSEKAGVEAACR